MIRFLFLVAFWLGGQVIAWAAEPIIIGLNNPKIGPYKEEGLAQMRGSLLAIEEINEMGGVLGRPLQLITENTASQSERAVKGIDSMVAQGAVMVFGSVSSAVAIASGKRAKEHKVPYFATIGYSDDVTQKDGHRYIFRESTSATMTGRALGAYLTQHYSDKKYFYITADYTWGHSSEFSLRANTHTQDLSQHPSTLLPFPNARLSDYNQAMKEAAASKADILVLVLYGQDLVRAMQIAEQMGLTRSMQIVAPNLTQSVIDQAGPALMSGVIGTEHWFWRVPEIEQSTTGESFVKAFYNKYEMYPSSSAASAYTVVKQWAQAAQRAGTTSSEAIIKALENHEYSLLKDKAVWRGFDHQNIQTVYVVRVNERDVVIKHPSHQDYFELIGRLDGVSASLTHSEWQEERRAAGLAVNLK